MVRKSGSGLTPLRKAMGDNLDMEACRATRKRGKGQASDSTLLQAKTLCKPWKFFCVEEMEPEQSGKYIKWEGGDEKGQGGIRLHR
jgi:hypothetical protein